MKKVSAATRQDLINKSLRTTKGKQRFYRRLFSKIEYPNRSLSRIDTNKWFKEDILDADITVKGETDTYVVTISFYGVWEEYEGELSQRTIKDAITRAFRTNDVYVYCSCPDFYYRYSYVATQNNYITNQIQTIPAPIRNPHDSLGSGCKHLLLCLFQSYKWINELANNTYKYIKYIKNRDPALYERIIAPRIEAQGRNDLEDPMEMPEQLQQSVEDGTEGTVTPPVPPSDEDDKE